MYDAPTDLLYLIDFGAARWVGVACWMAKRAQERRGAWHMEMRVLPRAQLCVAPIVPHPCTLLLLLLILPPSRDFPASFVDEYMQMVRACAERDRDGVVQRSLNMGFLTGGCCAYEHAARERSSLLRAPPCLPPCAERVLPQAAAQD